MTCRKLAHATVALLIAVLMTAAVLRAQEGQDLLELNTITEDQLKTLPHVTEGIAKKIVEQRPYSSIVDANMILLGAELTAEQATEIYRKAFVRVNLNTGTSEEFLLIPGVGRRMAHEFEEYRPWKTQEQFEREIGKYVDETEVARLWRYVTIE